MYKCVWCDKPKKNEYGMCESCGRFPPTRLYKSKQYSCEFCGLYIAKKPNCNKCEETNKNWDFGQ